jgi:hypothetical protein
MVVYHIRVVKWPVCRSVVVQGVVLPSRVHTYIYICMHRVAALRRAVTNYVALVGAEVGQSCFV